MFPSLTQSGNIQTWPAGNVKLDPAGLIQRTGRTRPTPRRRIPPPARRRARPRRRSNPRPHRATVPKAENCLTISIHTIKQIRPSGPRRRRSRPSRRPVSAPPRCRHRHHGRRGRGRPTSIPGFASRFPTRRCARANRRVRAGPYRTVYGSRSRAAAAWRARVRLTLAPMAGALRHAGTDSPNSRLRCCTYSVKPASPRFFSVDDAPPNYVEPTAAGA